MRILCQVDHRDKIYQVSKFGVFHSLEPAMAHSIRAFQISSNTKKLLKDAERTRPHLDKVMSKLVEKIEGRILISILRYVSYILPHLKVPSISRVE